MANDNEIAVRRFYEALSTGDSALVDEALAAGWEAVPPLRAGGGPEGWKANIAHLRGVFADLTVEIEHVVVNRDMVAVRTVSRGKHTGELLGVEAPAGRSSSGRPTSTRWPTAASCAPGTWRTSSRSSPRSDWSSPVALDGKTAVVTGAARGIGYAYCQRLAADGAHVVAVDIDDPADAVSELTGGGDKLGLVCDISEPSQVDAVTGTVLDRYGRCDILVNNAGIFPFTDLEHMSIELWRKVQAVNVESILLFARAFVPGMRTAGWGRIVNTGSGITLTQNRDLAT